MPAGGRARGTRPPQMLDLVLQVAGFDLPPLVVEGDQGGCGVAAVVEQGGGQAVDAGAAPGAGGDGDLAFDHSYLDATDPGQVRPVGVSAQDRQLAVAF